MGCNMVGWDGNVVWWDGNVAWWDGMGWDGKVPST